MGHKEEATSLDIDFSLAASRRLWTLLDAERLRLPPILYSQLLREVVEVLGLSDDDIAMAESRIVAAVGLLERRRDLPRRAKHQRGATRRVLGLLSAHSYAGNDDAVSSRSESRDAVRTGG